MSIQVPILTIYDCLLISFVHDLSDAQVEELQEAALQRLKAEEVVGLLLDVTGLDLIDSFMARSLDDLGIAAKAMGCRTVVAGLKPTIAMTLVEMGIELDHLTPVLNVDAGLSLLRGGARSGQRRVNGVHGLRSLAAQSVKQHLAQRRDQILENYVTLNPDASSSALRRNAPGSSHD